MNDKIKQVEEWFRVRGLDTAEPSKQMLKLFEELGELSAGIAKNQPDAIIDGLGDVLVVLIGLSMQLGLDLTECLEVAYNEIKDRRGKLVNGVFVKEEDYV